jgi:iron complex outermembrane receptor protein
VGELSAGLSRTQYRKRFSLPGAPVLTTRSEPWLYNVTGAAYLGPRLSAYAGYARGLEESGIAPNNATNRNQPLPAILTRQVDAGFRYRLTDGLRLSGGVFDLRKPYYNLDAANRFDLLGDVVNRGIELSLAGAVTPRLSTVVGGVLLRPRVTGEGVALGRVGRRPIGLAARSLDVNLDWRPPILEGLSFDVGVSSVSDVPATRDNRVSIPARTLVDLGGRYRFKLGTRDATFRFQLSNVGNVYGYDLRGAGAYDPIQQRQASAYLTVDF